MTTSAGIEVSGKNSRVFVKVVDDGLSHLDPVIDKCEAFVLAFSANDGHSCQCVEVGSDDLSNAVRFHLHF